MNQPSIHIQKTLEYYLERHFIDGRSLVTAEIGSSGYATTFEAHAFNHAALDEADLTGQIDVHTSFDIIYVLGTYGFLDLAGILRSAIGLLNESAVLVLSHLDVPTTHFCYQYLKEAEGLTLHLTMENTAFFGYQRTGVFDSEGWMRAGFNARNYPAFNHQSYAIRPSLPFRLSYEGYSSPLSEELQRGFMVRTGRVYSEGSYSRLKLNVRPGAPQPVEVAFRFRPIGANSRPNAAVDIRFGSAPLSSHSLTGQKEFVAKAQIDLPEDGSLIVDMFHHALVEASQLDEQQIDLAPFCRPNIELIDITIRPLKHAGPQCSISRHVGQVSTFSYAGQMFRFFVDDRHDSIQAHHYAGEFYEIDELELIGRYLAPRARILDVGANIGNHAVYFERVLKAERVVAIELQPRVIEVLRLNVALNELVKTDLSKTGVGFGSSSHHASIHIPQLFNVAGAQFKSDRDGRFNIVRGDDVLAGESFDLLKIDIEGMECQAIDGLRATIARSHPLLFVEVWLANQARFDEQMAQLGYVTIEEFSRYDIATNYLMRHRDAF